MVTLSTAATIAEKMILGQPSRMKAALGENQKRLYGLKGKGTKEWGLLIYFARRNRKLANTLDKKHVERMWITI